MQENTDGFNRPLGILGKNIANKIQEKTGPFWNKWAELFSNRLWLPMINFASKKKLSRPHTKENKWFSFSGIRTNSLQQKNHLIDETLMKRIASYVSKSEDTCKQIKTTQRVISRQKNTNKIAVGKCIWIRLYPNKEQREKLRKWIGTTLWTYNRCLHGITKENVKRTKKTYAKTLSTLMR